MIVTALNLISLLVLFAVGGMFFVVLKSPKNMRFIASYLEARAHAEEDLARATQLIRAQQRAYQIEREREMGLAQPEEAR
jgi:hypothetical protein